MEKLQVFSNEELGLSVRAIKNQDGSIGMSAEDTAFGFGFTTVAKSGNDTIRWSRVNNYCKEFGFSTQVRKGDFIPESLFYLLGMKASNKKAVKFQKWIAVEVLPSIRKHGAFIGENADKDYVKNELRFSKGRTIKTFANSNVSELPSLYSEFREYVDAEYKGKTDERLARYKSVEKGLDRLHDEIATDVSNIGDCYNIRKLKEEVIIDRTTLEKRISGGLKSGKTKQIAKLEHELENSVQYPRESEFVSIDCHGYSNNYMYRYAEGGVYKTQAYNNWIRDFPYDQVPDLEFWDDVNWDEPIEILLNYTAKADMDIRNMDKSIIDMLITKIYEFDDNIVDVVRSQRVGVCDSFEDGRIGFYIRNI